MSQQVAPEARTHGDMRVYPRMSRRAHLISHERSTIERRFVAVGTRVTSRPPHRSVRAAFPHTAPTSDA